MQWRRGASRYGRSPDSDPRRPQTRTPYARLSSDAADAADALESVEIVMSPVRVRASSSARSSLGESG
jgi:hypothetical protein